MPGFDCLHDLNEAGDSFDLSVCSEFEGLFLVLVG